jgi:hypothetical protein
MPTRGFEGRSLLHDQMTENPFLSFLAEGPAETIRREREASPTVTRAGQFTARPPVDAGAAGATAAEAATSADVPPAGIAATDPAPVSRYAPSTTFASIDAMPAAGDTLPKQREMAVAPQMLTKEQRAQIQARNALERKEKRETKRQMEGSRQVGIGTFAKHASGVPPTQPPPVLMPTPLPGRGVAAGRTSQFIGFSLFPGFTLFLDLLFSLDEWEETPSSCGKISRQSVRCGDFHIDSSFLFFCTSISSTVSDHVNAAHCIPPFSPPL